MSELARIGYTIYLSMGLSCPEVVVVTMVASKSKEKEVPLAAAIFLIMKESLVTQQHRN